jgi:hypothetical protein
LSSKGFRAIYELTWKSLKSLKIWPVARRLHFGCTPVSSIFYNIKRGFFKSKYMVFFQKMKDLLFGGNLRVRTE